MQTSRLADELYEKLTNDEDARACDDISEEACRETPGNFVLILISYFFTKLGDAIASPKTVLAWVTSAVGAPAYVLSFLVPIRESGSLMPQLLIAGYIRALPIRKWVWVAGSVVQAVAVVGLGLVAVTLDGAQAGRWILALIVLFSLARGFCSISAKDVIGKTVPKKKRGQLTGWSASAAGLVSVGVGVALLLPALQKADVMTYGFLLVGAGLLWVAGAASYSLLTELPGATEGGRNAGSEAIKRLSVLRDDRAFRRFVMARALLMCSALSAPYYVALAQNELGSPTYLLGLFVVAAGLAGLVSAPFWGRFADRSSKQVMVMAALVTAGIGLATYAVNLFFPSLAATSWFLPLAYFILSLAHSGVRVGRKTYVVDLASGNKRTDYVAVSNSVIGVLLLMAGAIGLLAPLISNAGVIAVLAGMGLLGAISCSRLEEVES